MSDVIQERLIRHLLQPLANAMAKLSERTKNALFLISGMGIVLQLFLWNMTVAQYRYLIFFAVDCLFLGVMILCGMGREIKPVKFRRALMLPWLAAGVFILQSGIRLNADYLPEAVLFLVAYPILFICWINGDRTRIFKLLVTLCRLTAAVYIVGSFLFAKITPSQYSGIFNNTNGAAYMLSTAAAFLFAEIMYASLKSWKTVLDVLLLGMTLALNYYTNSRTGPLGIGCALALCLIIYVLTHPGRESAKCIVRVAVSLAVAAALLPGMLYAFGLRQNWNLPYLDPLTGEFYSEYVQPGGTQNGGNAGAEKPNPGKQPPIDLSGYQTIISSKTNSEGKTLDQYSTGRISVWLAYAKDLNWFGHASVPRVYIEMIYKEIATTHMTALQFAYESGIFAGVCYLIFNIGSGLAAIWFAWKNRREQYACLPLMVIVVFGVMSMLGSCNVTFWYFTTLCYNFVLFPLMGDTEKMPEPADSEKM